MWIAKLNAERDFVGKSAKSLTLGHDGYYEYLYSLYSADLTLTRKTSSESIE